MRIYRGKVYSQAVTYTTRARGMLAYKRTQYFSRNFTMAATAGAEAPLNLLQNVLPLYYIVGPPPSIQMSLKTLFGGKPNIVVSKMTRLNFSPKMAEL